MLVLSIVLLLCLSPLAQPLVAPSAHRPSTAPSAPRPSTALLSTLSSEKPKIQFLICDTGGGHRASALSLRSALSLSHPAITCDIVDIYSYTTAWPFNSLPHMYAVFTKCVRAGRGGRAKRAAKVDASLRRESGRARSEHEEDARLLRERVAGAVVGGRPPEPPLRPARAARARGTLRTMRACGESGRARSEQGEGARLRRGRGRERERSSGREPPNSCEPAAKVGVDARLLLKRVTGGVVGGRTPRTPPAAGMCGLADRTCSRPHM
jgi:hypothetical protein